MFVKVKTLMVGFLSLTLFAGPSLAATKHYIEDAVKYPVETARLIEIATTHIGGQRHCSLSDLVSYEGLADGDQLITRAEISTLLMLGLKLKETVMVNTGRYTGLVFVLTDGRQVPYVCSAPISS